MTTVTTKMTAMMMIALRREPRNLVDELSLDFSLYTVIPLFYLLANRGIEGEEGGKEEKRRGEERRIEVPRAGARLKVLRDVLRCW